MWLWPNSSTALKIGYSDDANGTLWSEVTVSNLAVGTYYVRIQEYGNNGTIDGCTLFLDVIPPTVTCVDSYEPDDTAGTAKVIADGKTQNRGICTGNEDWVKFTLATTSDVLLRTGARSGFSGGDTVMWLYGPNNSTTQIGYNDDATGTRWSQLTLSKSCCGHILHPRSGIRQQRRHSGLHVVLRCDAGCRELWRQL